MRSNRFSILSTVKNSVGFALVYAPRSMRTYVKEAVELAFWRKTRRVSAGGLYNRHFERYFTVPFDLERSFFDGKRMLDVGCGPAGSLEWAEGALERVGADPLADRYRTLDTEAHAMTYVTAASEDLPFEDGCFDVVSMLNALDHVDDPQAAIRELERVTAPGGDILLVVEVDHPPTLTEPHRLREADILSWFRASTPVCRKLFAMNEQHSIYGSIHEAQPRKAEGDPAVLCARLRRN
jgi:SAM-dependent methyltransferase